MSLRAVSFGDWFCSSRKGGTGDGWVHLQECKQWKKILGRHGWPISVLFGIYGFINNPSHLAGPCIQGPCFSYSILAFPGSLDLKFANWWVWFDVRSYLWEEFQAQQPEETVFKGCRGLLKCFEWEIVRNPLDLFTCMQSAVPAFRSGTVLSECWHSIQCWYYVNKYSLPYGNE